MVEVEEEEEEVGTDGCEEDEPLRGAIALSCGNGIPL